MNFMFFVCDLTFKTEVSESEVKRYVVFNLYRIRSGGIGKPYRADPLETKEKLLRGIFSPDPLEVFGVPAQTGSRRDNVGILV